MKKAELLVNLKLGGDVVMRKGVVFDEPFPHYISQELKDNRGTVREFDVSDPIQTKSKELPKQEPTKKRKSRLIPKKG